MDKDLLWIPYISISIIFVVFLFFSFMRYRSKRVNKRHFQAFLILHRNELKLIEQGRQFHRIDSIFALGEIIHVFKYHDAQKVVQQYPELLSEDGKPVTVQFQDDCQKTSSEFLVKSSNNDQVVLKEYRSLSGSRVLTGARSLSGNRPLSALSTHHMLEDKELEVIKL